MRALWLSLALVSAAGCFGSHREPPTRHDPPTCGAPSGIGGFVNGLGCPPREIPEGTEATFTVDSRPEACCDEAAPEVRVSRLAGTIDVHVAWSGCGCCLDDCGCAPSAEPSQTETVSLGVLEPGFYTIQAGAGPTTSRCEFNVVAPPGPMCVPGFVADFRSPRVLYEDQEWSVTGQLRRASGCGCSAEIVGRGIPAEVSMSLCGCCEECECVDPGYEASAVLGRVAVGDHVVDIGIDRGLPIAVRERERCHPVRATGISVVGPDDLLRVSEPRFWWARIEGEELLCCAEPLPVVDEVRGSPDAIALELASCVEADCDCIPKSATPFFTWHSLGELAPGTYSVRVGTVATTFTVP